MRATTIAALYIAAWFALPAWAGPVFPTAAASVTLAQFKAEAAARAAALRAAWLKSGRVAADAAPPSVTGGRILTLQLSPKRPPAAPAVSISFSTDSSGLSSYTLFFMSASSSQSLVLSGFGNFDGPPETSGRQTIQQPAGAEGGFGSLGPYAASGTWLLSSISISSMDGQSSFYSGQQIALLFAHPTYKVSNASADSTPPTLSDGMILTPHVSLSAPYPTFRARVAALDDASGVRFVTLGFQSPGGVQQSFYGAGTTLTAPSMSGTLSIKGVLPANAPTGTYTIISYDACDVAGNCASNTSSADVIALFGSNTFKVTE